MKLTDIINSKAKEIINGAPKEATHFSCIEGKTHYYKGEETVISSFDEVFINVFRDIFQPSVFPLSDLENQMNIDNLATQTPEEKEALDLIDTTPQQYDSVASKEVEWVNGDKCIYQGKEWQFVSILSEYFHSTAVLFNVDTEELKQVPVDSLSKPETPQQREERERLEAAYDLYCEECRVMECSQFTFNEFKDEQHLKARLLAIVDKTNYRKDSN